MKKIMMGAVFILPAEVAVACPMCSDLLERGKDAAGFFRLTEGVAWSMALMLAVPAAITASLGFYFYKSLRKKSNASS